MVKKEHALARGVLRLFGLDQMHQKIDISIVSLTTKTL